MTHDEAVVTALCKKFPFLSERISVQREKRIFTKPLTPEEFQQIIPYVHRELNFYRACHVVGTDDGDTLGLLYILTDKNNTLLILRESVPKSNPVVKSISSIYPSILLHERELADLFGVVVEGLPEGPRYPLPDGWPEGNYPMRKEWNPKYFDKNTMTYNDPNVKEVK
ncbi:MAG TPA: NADH-quinone oxidoreductase subunit C [Bacillota bacterium]|nr:NADH-quinone oxidoreductase subunit C [Bacillota bacterium]HOK69462.1 NADH-quinone oxidoreductase subunit C [Bacillota bacterium]HPP86058.1 NADH-quinone oxidoreductase subunit C [Bacillota bacterium]